MLTKTHIEKIRRVTKQSTTPEHIINTWSTIIGTFKPTKYLEIGAFEGHSLALFATLASYFSQETIHATSIDSWEGGDEHKCSAHPMQDAETRYDKTTQILKNGLQDQFFIEKIKGYSSQQLARIFDRTGFYDFIYIDAGHKSKEVLADMIFTWPLLRQGGIMILDDYTWIATHSGQQDLLLNSPKMGIDAFINCHSDEVTHLSIFPLLQLYLLKQHPLQFSQNAITVSQLPTPEIGKYFLQ